MCSARGRCRAWRAARRAAEEAPDGNGVGETQRQAEESEGEKWEWRKGETGQSKHSAHCLTLTNCRNSSSDNSSSNSSGSDADTPVMAEHRKFVVEKTTTDAFKLEELVSEGELLFRECEALRDEVRVRQRAR